MSRGQQRGPCVVLFKHPMRPLPLTYALGGECEFPYHHSWTFAEGERIPTVVEVAYVERFSHAQADPCPAGVHAFADINNEDPPQWATKESNPIDDINAFLKLIDSPGYKAAQRRAREEDMFRLARLLEAAGYGPLPPPYGSGA
jgi:hypothetical protein